MRFLSKEGGEWDDIQGILYVSELWDGNQRGEKRVFCMPELWKRVMQKGEFEGFQKQLLRKLRTQFDQCQKRCIIGTGRGRKSTHIFYFLPVDGGSATETTILLFRIFQYFIIVCTGRVTTMIFRWSCFWKSAFNTEFMLIGVLGIASVANPHKPCSPFFILDRYNGSQVYCKGTLSKKQEIYFFFMEYISC